ncbi:dipeptide ABC transporter ATP-binding protein [Jhaorihella thermophila]|uniref:Dipeptide transport system ATP-binding protein n=1 Tax=Jhaorihella thermophila TaxID=488547 RepID=A0A1H5YDL1_9RHOB|nr:dipeptide ABC transporter ATP-binding protein [Jhaorihella thermophila]SEG22098.1 dipeptide transport system ATP-binding protein [Jhaorihella thermophila]
MSEQIVTARNLARHYEVKQGFLSAPATVRALSDVSFDLRPGQTLAVVGESGCGKSTLARLVTMIEEPTGGELRIKGEAVTRDHWASLRSSVQIVFQDPYGSLNPRQRISTILQEPLKINRPDMSAEERDRLAREKLALVGLRPEHYDRFPHMFSGGQRQRISIARALMLDPAILVLDEPISALDVSIQSQILNLLVELQERLGLAYLFISHDLSVVRHFCDDVIVMYLGRVVEQGPSKEVFANPRHPYTKALISATPRAVPGSGRKRIKLQGELPSPMDLIEGCPFAPRCWRVTDQCRKSRPELSGGAHGIACYNPED